MSQTLATLSTMSDEELKANGYSDDTIQKIRSSAGTTVAPDNLEQTVKANTASSQLKPTAPLKQQESVIKKDKGATRQTDMRMDGGQVAAQQPAPEQAEPSQDVQAATAEEPTLPGPVGPQTPKASEQPAKPGVSDYYSSAKGKADTKSNDKLIIEAAESNERVQAQKDMLQRNIDRDVKGGFNEEGIQIKYKRDFERLSRAEQENDALQMKAANIQGGMPMDAAPVMEEEAPATKEEQDALHKQAQQLMAMQQKQSDVDGRLVQMMAEQDRKIAELSKRNVDPGRYWKNRTSGQRAWTMIGVMFSGVGGGGNSALQMLNQEIDRDVATQKEAIANEMKALQMSGDKIKLQSQLAKKGTVNTRALAHELNVIDATIEQAKRLGSKPKANQEAVAATIAALQQRRANVQAGLADSLANGAKFADDMVGPNWDGSLMTPKQLERFVPGYGLSVSPTARETFIRDSQPTKFAADGIDRVLSFAKDANRLSPEDRNRLATEMKALMGQLRVPLTGGGTMTDQDFKRLEDTVGDPNAILSIKQWELVKLKTIQGKLKNDLDVMASQAFPGYKSQQFNTFKPK